MKSRKLKRTFIIRNPDRRKYTGRSQRNVFIGKKESERNGRKTEGGATRGGEKKCTDWTNTRRWQFSSIASNSGRLQLKEIRDAHTHAPFGRGSIADNAELCHDDVRTR